MSLLGTEKDKKIIIAVKKLLKHKDKDVRISSIDVLSRIADDNIIEDLAGILINDEEEDVRWAAATVIGIIGNKDAIGVLETGINDKSEVVRKACEKALNNLLKK